MGLTIYYSFIAKADKTARRVAAVAGFGGLVGAIYRFIDQKYPDMHDAIRNIFIIPIFATIILLFYLLIKNALKARHDPEQKIMMNIGLGLIVLAIILIVIIALLKLEWIKIS